MVDHEHNRIKNSSITFRVSAVAFAILFVLMAIATAQAQTFKVIYNFIGAPSGWGPYAGVTLDAAGNLYGAAADGVSGGGTIFKLTPKGSGWVFNVLYRFAGGSDGSAPYGGVIFGPDGTLYGTTVIGGALGDGTVFNLRPPPTICTAVLCPWKETVLYSFTGRNDGGEPLLGDLIFDQGGNIYGTTSDGGSGGGVVYQLTPSGSGWTESVLHTFGDLPNDGWTASGGVIFDNAGNLYGTTVFGGSSNVGTVFQLTKSGSSWTENILHSFQGNDGTTPYAGLIFDRLGNLYGATTDSGSGGGGTVFELTPSNGSWKLNILYSFTGTLGHVCGPSGTLVMDGAGSLYGTTHCDGAYNQGSVFKLAPSGNGPWTYTSLHDFTGGDDGRAPYSSVVFDADGNLYGTTWSGGTGCRYDSCGVVWEITP